MSQQQESACGELTSEDFQKIRLQAIEQNYKRGELIFSEGDEADYIYFIESGKISIFIQKFTSREEISVLGAGDYFGEMAVFYKDKRAASMMALTDTTLLSVDKNAFLQFIKEDRPIGEKINRILARRNEELVLKERLLDITGVKRKNLQISIKGDPSLRESAFTRGRYDSLVDKVLPQLEPRLQELLINRCVYELFIHFNSGEVRIGSIFDHFKEDIHPANKLADDGYIERHFPPVPFEEKSPMVKRLYQAISSDPCFARLPSCSES